jgi:predicted dehydrogenase
MAGKSLNWGILGTARINRALLGPLRTARRSQLLAVASRDVARAREFAGAREIPRAYGSYEALLSDPDIDVVYIPLPNGLHAEWSILAADSGKHVLCEKPLAPTLAEVNAIAQAAATNGVVIAEAFMYRHHPQTLLVKELVENGEIGDLRLMRGAFTFPLTAKQDIRLDPAQGGGSIWDVGCYPISYSRFVAGAEPLEAIGWQWTGPTGVDLLFAGQLRFPNGSCAHFDSGFRTDERMMMEFVGSRGHISLANAFKPGPEAAITVHTHGRGTREYSCGADLYLGEVEDMEAAALDGRPQRLTLEDSRANIATILALIESAETARSVTLGS